MLRSMGTKTLRPKQSNALSSDQADTPRSREIVAAQSSWLADQIPSKRIPALINLSGDKDAVLVFLADRTKADVHKAFKFLENDVLVLLGVDNERLHSEFEAVERYCNDHRSSVVSSSGSATSRLSIFSQSSARSSFSSMLSQYSELSLDQQRYFCPTCGKSFGKPSDMLGHMRKICEKENLLRYKCRQCDAVEEVKARMRMHVERRHKTKDRIPMGFDEFELPDKESFGCPHLHCERSFDTLSEYHEHLIQHFRKDKINHRGSLSCRVRAGIRTTGLAEVVRMECMRQNRPADSWETGHWDDIDAFHLWDHLEYGIRDPNVDYFSCMGVTDAPTFVREIVKGLREAQWDDSVDATLAGFDGGEDSIGPVDGAEPSSTGPTIAHMSPASLAPTPPVLQHPAMEPLRNKGKAPMRNFSVPSATSRQHDMQAPPPTQPQLTSRPADIVPTTAAGHKHNLSAGSVYHPDGVDRSRNSPVPPSHAGQFIGVAVTTGDYDAQAPSDYDAQAQADWPPPSHCYDDTDFNDLLEYYQNDPLYDDQVFRSNGAM